MTQEVVITVSAYWVRAPLSRPYGLSFGTLTAFDLLIVRLVDSSGRIGYGESCPVPPYSHESAEEVWRRLIETLPTLPGEDVNGALSRLESRADSTESFAYVAVSTALESLAHPPQSRSDLTVPIVGTVLTHDIEDLPAEVERLLDEGYRTLKVKVGFDPADDLAAVALIKRCSAGSAALRLDANEAWNFEQTSAFLRKIDPNGIELLEQPFPRDRWDWVSAIKGIGSVPLMLDESISGDESIERAAQAGADIIKLKLMKVGTRSVLRQRIRHAQDLGLGVVIGNGVAGVVDNWYEALCAAGTGRAGEMNGNLKIADSVFDCRPYMENGNLKFPAGFDLKVDEAELSERSMRRVQYS